jgi:hypothetical protein
MCISISKATNYTMWCTELQVLYAMWHSDQSWSQSHKHIASSDHGSHLLKKKLGFQCLTGAYHIAELLN